MGLYSVEISLVASAATRQFVLGPVADLDGGVFPYETVVLLLVDFYIWGFHEATEFELI